MLVNLMQCKLQRSGSFWFEEGALGLKAVSSQQSTLFSINMPPFQLEVAFAKFQVSKLVTVKFSFQAGVFAKIDLLTFRNFMFCAHKVSFIAP